MGNFGDEFRRWTMKSKNKKREEFYIDILGSTPEYVMEQLSRLTEEQRKNSKFELDFSNCYYEGDIPTIKLRIGNS